MTNQNQQSGKAEENAQPKVLAKTVNNELEVKADEIVKTLQAGADRDYINSVMNLGREAQMEASRELGMLKTRVGTLLGELDNDNAKIPQGLVSLRKTLDEINPNAIEKPGFFSRMFSKVPVVGDRLKEIAIRYESVQTQIDIIIRSLREGQDALIRDNIDLENLFDQIKVQQNVLKKNAELGEILIRKLEVMKEAAINPADKQKIQTVLHAVAMRVQDLRTMEQVNEQFFVSIDLTTGNNKLLGQAVDRTLTIAVNTIQVGLAIQAAIVNQGKVIEATRATQDYAAEVLSQNAKAIGKQAQEIGNLYTNPVLALEKVKESYDELVRALDEVDKIKASGIESAKKGIAELSAMSSELSMRAQSVRPDTSLPESTTIKSLEA